MSRPIPHPALNDGSVQGLKDEPAGRASPGGEERACKMVQGVGPKG